MIKVFRTTLLALLVLSFLACSGQVMAESNYEINADIQLLNNQLQNKQKQLSQIREEQKQYNELIEKYQHSQVTLESQLAILENRVTKAGLDIAETELGIDQSNLEIRKLGLDIQAKDKEIENEKDHLGNLLQLVYKQNQVSTLEILLLHDSLAEFLNEARYLEDTNEEIGNSLDDLRRYKSIIEQDQQRKVKKSEELTTLKDSLERKRDALVYEENSKNNVLAATEAKESQYQTLLTQAKQEQTQATAEINSIESTVRQRLAQLEGNKLEFLDSDFAWPIPENYITATFHDPGYPFRHILGEHPAIDIRSSQGSTLRAAASGYVAKVRYDGTRRYAYIMLIHADGFSTVYGHVSKVNVSTDQYVLQGQVIGATGGAPGTPGSGYFSTGPHLHFEIRKEGIPVNPLNHLP